MKDLLLVGGGHSHLEVLRRWRANSSPDVRVTLLSPGRYAAYSGMIPGLIAGHYRFHDAHIDLLSLCKYAGATPVAARAVKVDLERKVVLSDVGHVLPFTVLSLNTGSTPDQSLAQASSFLIPVKPIESLLDAWEKVSHQLLVKRGGSIAVVGAGAAGVEVLLAMQHRISNMLGEHAANVSFHLVGDIAVILPQLTSRARRIFERILSERRVHLHLGSEVVGAEPGRLLRNDAPPLIVDHCVISTSACAPAWLGASGLHTDESGFVRVNDSLQSLSHPMVFAAGDVASQEGYHYPKSGVFAVKQAPVLAHNLRAKLSDAKLVRYIPQTKALALISTGNRYVVAARGRLVVKGGWLWQWKDWIDRRFVGRYRVT